MARGTHISQILTQAQLDVLLQIDEHEIDIFSLADLIRLSGDFTLNINEVIKTLCTRNCFYALKEENIAG